MSTYLIVMSGLAFSKAGMMRLAQRIGLGLVATVAVGAPEGQGDLLAGAGGRCRCCCCRRGRCRPDVAAADAPVAAAAVVPDAPALEPELLPQAEVSVIVPMAATPIRRVVRLPSKESIELLLP